jgi:hypothetical protein
MVKCMWPPCPNEADSEEHLFPDWLNGVLPAGKRVRYVPFDAALGQQPVAGRPSKKPATRKNKVVCIPCNTGWMAVIEQEAKRLMEPMILGDPATLTPADQLHIATWATMRAYVWEERSGDRVSTDEDRSILYEQRRPSGNTRVRLAAFQGAPGELVVAIYNLPVFDDPAPPDNRPVAYAATIVLGALIIQVVGRPTSEYRAFETVGVTNDATVQILPPVIPRGEWPPRALLSSAVLEQFITAPFPQYPRDKFPPARPP